MLYHLDISPRGVEENTLYNMNRSWNYFQVYDCRWKRQGKAVIKEGEHMRKVLRPESGKRNIRTDYIRF
jgi:hypothetical protein